MSTNPHENHSGHGSTKPTPPVTQPVQAQTPDAKGKKPTISPPEKPTTPQAKSKSCCG